MHIAGGFLAKEYADKGVVGLLTTQDSATLTTLVAEELGINSIIIARPNRVADFTWREHKYVEGGELKSLYIRSDVTIPSRVVIVQNVLYKEQPIRCLLSIPTIRRGYSDYCKQV